MFKNNSGNPAPVYSIASGLDYPSVGPEHAFLRNASRVTYEAIEAFYSLSRYEGIIPAIESSHALVFAIKRSRCAKRGSILVNLSRRGDKDIGHSVKLYGYGEHFVKGDFNKFL